MAKVMLFIDGTWLYANVDRLAQSYGDDNFHLDFGKLPGVLKEEIADQLGGTEVDIVRTYLFGSFPDNCDVRDEDAIARRLDFFEMLKEEYHYELELFPINFRGKRLRKADRDPRDTFEPKEKCVDISLATSMLYFAAIPYAYDIAIAVIGDQDFKPVLQHVRRLGKRVSIASIKGSCAPDYADPRDEARVKDFDIIWLDDLLDRLALKYERRQIECQSPQHRGDRRVWTTFYVRRGQKFYCEKCRTEFTKQKRDAAERAVRDRPQPLHTSTDDAPSADVSSVEDEGGSAFLAGTNIDPNNENTATSESGPPALFGIIKTKFPDRKYGFIRADDGREYYFNPGDLEPGTDFGVISERDAVVFEIRRHALPEKAGAASRVRLQQPDAGSA